MAGTFRGRYVVVYGTGQNTGVFVYSGTPALGNLIASIAPSANTDPWGNAYDQGFCSYITGVVGQLFGGKMQFYDPAFVPANKAGLELAAAGAAQQEIILTTGNVSTDKAVLLSMNSATSQAVLSGTGTAIPQTSALLEVQGSAAIGTSPAGVIFIPPSGDATGATDLNAINQALSVGACVVPLPGDYYINGALQPQSYSAIRGPNRDLCTIHQVSTTANGIELGSTAGFTGSGFTLLGPGSGSGQGIHGNGSPLQYVYLDGVKVRAFGSHGVNLGGPIICHLRQVVAEICGGDGFSLFVGGTASNPTSTLFDACYANGNTGVGFALAGLHYGVLNACVADTNSGVGFALSACEACTLNGCSAESSGSAVAQMTMSNGRCNTVNGMFFYASTAASLACTSEVEATLTGLHEQNPSAATAFISTDVNSRVVVINDDHTTANSFAAGTGAELLYNGVTVH